MKFLIEVFFISIALLLLNNCDTTDPPIIPPPPPVVKDTITVAVESFTHRSVTLNIKTTANSKNSSVRLIRTLNSITTTVAEFSILVKDTTIIDDNNGTGLLLDTTYTYYAVRVDSVGQLKDTSNTVTQKTLAPTSHNYMWQEYTMGDWQSSLYDVWGTDENNVYACGGVTINDTIYGILHWNGVEWKPFSKTAGGVAIYGFSINDIWTVGGSVFHYNGQVWSEVLFSDQVLVDNIPYTSIWGTSSNNLYLGNGGGKIIHWNGSKASIVYENPNSIPITDIYGTSSYFILACGSALSTPSIALLFDGINWNLLSGLNYNTTLFRTVLGWNLNEYFIGGSKNYRYLNGTLSEILQQAPGILERIRADKSTGEVVAVGDGFTLLHFNGLDWKDYSYELNQPNSAFYGVYLTNGKIFAVGAAGTIGKIFIGTQY